jgi:hypothetical protein
MLFASVARLQAHWHLKWKGPNFLNGYEETNVKTVHLVLDLATMSQKWLSQCSQTVLHLTGCSGIREIESTSVPGVTRGEDVTVTMVWAGSLENCDSVPSNGNFSHLQNVQSGSGSYRAPNTTGITGHSFEYNAAGARIGRLTSI